MAGRQWAPAEEVLAAALTAAEAAAGGGSAPGGGSSSSSGPGGGGGVLVPALLLLAAGYCRSARVMLAEGLLREAAKLLGGSEPARRVACVGARAVSCWCGGLRLLAAQL
jgi:hypothetical protein